MSLRSLLSFLLLYLPPLISAIPSDPANNRFVNFGSGQAPNTSVPVNASTSTSSNDLTVQCLPARYGKNIPFVDCVDAFQQISPDDEEYEWWPRHIGIRKEHFPLPFRFQGRNARCYIEPKLAPGAMKGVASLNMVAEGAHAIMDRCISSDKANGGVAHGIGGNNGLIVTLGAYRGPIPACRGTVRDQRTAEQCRGILDDMEVETRTQTFGPGVDPRPDVVLPALIRTTNDACVLRIFGQADTARWLQIWEAATAIWSMCVRGAKGGSVTGLGDNRKLFMTLTTPISLLGNGNGTGIAES